MIRTSTERRRARPSASTKARPVGVGLEDVALQEHAFAGLVDGGEHRRIRLLPVEERLDPVAVEQGAPGHRLGHAGDVAKPVIEVRERHPGSGFRPVADLIDAEPRDPAGFELSRPGRDAVHTEDQVEDRPPRKERTDRRRSSRRRRGGHVCSGARARRSRRRPPSRASPPAGCRSHRARERGMKRHRMTGSHRTKVSPSRPRPIFCKRQPRGKTESCPTRHEPEGRG